MKKTRKRERREGRGETRRRGFTLLEMLAATAMMALLAASLYASLHIAFGARKTALASVATARQFSQSLEVIRADFQSAVVPNGILAGSFVGTSGTSIFQQQGDSLVFYTASTDVEAGPGAGDIKKVEYACVSSPDLKEVLLVRRVTTNLLALVAPDPNEEVLCRGVKAFFLRYYDGSGWQENRDSAQLGNVLPKAIEVTIQVQVAGREDLATCNLVVPLPCGQGADPNAFSGMTIASGGSP